MQQGPDSAPGSKRRGCSGTRKATGSGTLKRANLGIVQCRKHTHTLNQLLAQFNSQQNVRNFIYEAAFKSRDATASFNEETEEETDYQLPTNEIFSSGDGSESDARTQVPAPSGRDTTAGYY